MSRILIDLSKLNNPYCGLGQIALNYGRIYGAQADRLMPGHEVTLLVPEEYVGRFGDKVDYLAVRTVYRYLPQLMPAFDVWHSVHQMSPYVPSRRRTRQLVTVHDVNFIYEKRGWKRERYRRALQRCLDRAQEVCFISHFAERDALQHVVLHGQPTHVIYNGVEDTTVGPQAKPAALADGAPFMLSIGEVKAKKNIHTLLPLMERMKDRRLVVAGNCRTAYAQQLMAQAEGMDNVVFLGMVSDEERRWLYAHCEALLFPSLFEGFGLPVVEAMQWGKPVFCSRSTSLPEIGGEHAFYFDSFEAEAMERCVREWLAAYSDNDAAAARTYAATFSYERHIQHYASLLQGLA